METINIVDKKIVNRSGVEGKYFGVISIFYPFEEIDYCVKRYDDGNYWYPYLLELVDNRINRNILDVKPELGLSLNIYLSKQFDRYFDNDEVKAFLREKYNEYEDVFLIGLVYKENRNGRILFDMLPCFTETSKKDEDLKNTAKRLVKEEVFSSWEGSNFASWYNNQFKKEIYAVEKKIDDVKIDYIESKNSDNTKDDVSRKVALYLWGYNIDSGIKFLNSWRSNQHNLGTAGERRDMVDVCLVWVKDILDILEA